MKLRMKGRTVMHVTSLRMGNRQIRAGRPWGVRCSWCSRWIQPWQVGQREGSGWDHQVCAIKRLMREWWAEKFDDLLFEELRRG